MPFISLRSTASHIFFLVLLGIHSQSADANIFAEYLGSEPIITSEQRLVAHGFYRVDGLVRDVTGRIRHDVKFVSRSGNVTSFFRESGISLVFARLNGNQSYAEATSASVQASPSSIESLHRMDIEFEGVNPHVTILTLDEGSPVRAYSPTHPDGYTSLSSTSLLYEQLYPGIDLLFRIEDGGLKYEFHLSPGADPSCIKLRYDGATDFHLTNDGDILARTSLGQITDKHPFGLQGNTVIPMRFIRDGYTLSFDLELYDNTQPLIIDPYLQWSSFFGGSTSDYARAVAIDASGSVFITGYTASVNFPVSPGAYQGKNAGSLDAFVMRLNPARALQWATYFGGSDQDESRSITIDRSGFIVIAGNSSSTDLPVTAGVAQPTNNGKSDVFIAKLDGSGRRVWCTYLGGSFSDECNGVAVDSQSDVVVTGGSYSTNFPVTKNAFQTSNAGDFDAFIAKLSANGAFVWGSYCGGWSMDYSNSLAIDASDNIVITGQTESTNFPVSKDAYQQKYGGGAFDVFLVKFNSSGTRLWSTLFGGNKEDAATHVITDPSGNHVVCGQTESLGLPVTKEAKQGNAAGLLDAFIAKFDEKGALSWFRYYGGTRNDYATSMGVDGEGNIAITGYTESLELQMTANAHQGKHAGLQDAYVARFNSEGRRLWSSYFGGNDQDIGYGLAVTESGNAFVVGSTGSRNFPTIGSPLQKEKSGYTDAFLLRIIFDEVVANAGPDTVICIGSSATIGRATKGGREPYVFSWQPSTALSSASIEQPVAAPKKTTTYVLTIRDAEGTASSDSVTVEVRSQPVAYAGNPVTICTGGQVQLVGTGRGGLSPYWFTWSPPDGLNSQDTQNPIAAPEKTTKYILTVRDKNGCVGKDTITVIVLPSVVADAGADAVICQGASSTLGGEVTGGQPPYQFLWSPASGLSDIKAQRPVATPDSTTRYILTATDSKGCKALDTVLIRVNPSATIVDVGDDIRICEGESIRLGGRPVQGKPPFRYAWIPAKGLNVTDVPTPIASPTITTSYVVSVIDANGCGGRDTITVTVVPKPLIDAGANVNMCEDSSSPIGNPATGGVPPYTYAWTPATGLNDPTVATPVASPKATTKYSVLVTDANGCSATASTTVTVHSVPRVTVDPNVSICRGSRRKITSTVKGGKGPFRYEWLPRNGLNQYDIPSPVASPDQTTLYIVTVIDANGCRSTDSIRITVRPCDKSDAGPDVDMCRDTEVTLGGAFPLPANEPRFFWSPSTGLSSPIVAKPIASPKQTTTYILKVTNTFGCEDFDTVTVRVSPGPTPNAGPPVSICEGGSAQIGRPASGGVPPYNYSWTPSAGLSDPNKAQPFAAPKSTTTYTVIVTDANGCSGSESVIVTVHPLPSIQLPKEVAICEGFSATLTAYASGGKGPFSFSWWPQTALDKHTIARPKATPLRSTSYVVTARNETGCASSDTVLVRVYPLPAPVIRASGTVTICDGESVQLTSDRIHSKYEWSNGSRSQTIEVNKSGTYHLVVEDEHGCRGKSNEITVTVNPRPIARITMKGATTICEGDEVELDAGKGFSQYQWSTGETTRSIRARKSGSYHVTVANASGCTARSDEETIVVRPRQIASITALRDTLIASPASDYQWMKDGKPVRGATAQRLIASESGLYSVRVGNTEDCPSTSESARITFGQAVVSIGKIESTPGSKVFIPLKLTKESNIERSGATSFTATLRIKKKVFSILTSTAIVRETGDDILVTIRGRYFTGSKTLTHIEARIASDAKGTIPVHVEEFKWIDGLVRTQTKDGSVFVKSTDGKKKSR